MNTETSFTRGSQLDDILNNLFEQRKEWFINSLKSAIESIKDDQIIYQMFQTPSTKFFIPDRICEIVHHTITDEREMYINQLFEFLNERKNLFDFDEFERVGSELLNLSTKQMEVEIDQRNKIQELYTSNDLNNKNTKHVCKSILRKLNSLNSLILTIGQEMRTFKRRIPLFLGKYKSMVFSSLNSLKSENTKLADSLLKLHEKYQKLKSEKIQNDKLFENYLEQLKSTQQKLENTKNQNIKILTEKVDVQSNEITLMKKQIKIFKEQIRQDQQKIIQLNQIIQKNEDVISDKIQNLTISQQIIQKLKDEFEKISFILTEIKKINVDQDKKEDILQQIKYIKSKIKSKHFESGMLDELKLKCQQSILTKDKVKQNLNDNLSDSHINELSTLIRICTDLTLQKELHEILNKINDKIKINLGKDETIKKLLKQLNKKTKENQRISIVNQKLQSQKDDLQQQIGDIKMQLRKNPSLSPLLSTSSRILFSPNKTQGNFSRTSIEVNATPKAFTRSEIINFNNRTFTEDDEYENEGDDEGESEYIENEISHDEYN